MKFAMSNIAWDPSEDDEVASLLRAQGFTGVEIAPTKTWPRPLEATREHRLELKRRWEDRGLPIVAMQSLLFGQPELKLFESADDRQRTADYLRGIIDLAADLGAGVLVFGSPANRKRGELAYSAAFAIAVPFFHALGEHAKLAGVTFCIEPNPSVYGCDFVRTSDEGRSLVDTVGSAGFGLHLDAAGLLLAGEAPEQAVEKHAAAMRHFHLSAPQLGLVGNGDTTWYPPLAQSLLRAGYDRWVSIEMRAAPPGEDSSERNSVRVATAAAFCRSLFEAR